MCVEQLLSCVNVSLGGRTPEPGALIETSCHPIRHRERWEFSHRKLYDPYRLDNIERVRWDEITPADRGYRSCGACNCTSPSTPPTVHKLIIKHLAGCVGMRACHVRAQVSPCRTLHFMAIRGAQWSSAIPLGTRLSSIMSCIGHSNPFKLEDYSVLHTPRSTRSHRPSQTVARAPIDWIGLQSMVLVIHVKYKDCKKTAAALGAAVSSFLLFCAMRASSLNNVYWQMHMSSRHMASYVV